jgi:acyl-CoA reductase-like NAD-dependent aldehyde dehydrogenase
LINALRSSNDSPKLTTINPATEQVFNEYEIITKDQLNYSVNKVRQPFLEWKNNINRRADFLYAFAKELRKNKESLARTVTQEIGKAIKEAKSEVEKCPWANRILRRSRKNLFN